MSITPPGGPKHHYHGDEVPAPLSPANSADAAKVSVKESQAVQPTAETVEQQQVKSCAEKTATLAQTARVIPTENEVNLAIKFLKDAKQMLKYPAVLKFSPEIIALVERISSVPVKLGTVGIGVLQTDTTFPKSLDGQTIKELAECASQLQDLDVVLFEQPLLRDDISKMFDSQEGSGRGSFVLGYGYLGRGATRIEDRKGQNTINKKTYPGENPTQMLTLSYCDKRDGKLHQEYLRVDNKTGEVLAIQTFPFQKAWEKTGTEFIRHYILSHPGIEISKIVTPESRLRADLATVGVVLFDNELKINQLVVKFNEDGDDAAPGKFTVSRVIGMDTKKPVKDSVLLTYWELGELCQEMIHIDKNGQIIQTDLIPYQNKPINTHSSSIAEYLTKHESLDITKVINPSK